LLRIARTITNTVLVAWPSSVTGFNLQQNAAIGSSTWLPVTNSVNTVGSEFQVIISPPVGNRFYRLKSP
jgi:hypothetical protein